MSTTETVASTRPEKTSPPPIAAGLVHFYTACGSVLGLLIVLAAIKGDAVMALWLGLAALVVDGTDGMLARRLRVKEQLPWFDGARLDDIVDYLTYAFAPMVLLYTTGFLPQGAAGVIVAAIPLMASSYQFCRTDAKTDDHFFLGFPSYWNVVAFYAITLRLSSTSVSAIIIVCSILVFVPVRYLYPSRTQRWRTLNLAVATAWLVVYAVVLSQMPDPSSLWLLISLAYIAYYAVASVLLTLSARSSG